MEQVKTKRMKVINQPCRTALILHTNMHYYRKCTYEYKSIRIHINKSSVCVYLFVLNNTI